MEITADFSKGDKLTIVHKPSNSILLETTIEKNPIIYTEYIGTQSVFNTGKFEGTSADRDDNSGDLGIGYLNGPNPAGGSLTKRLVGYWRMDRDVSGSSAVKDYSGEGNDGTTYGGVTTGATGVFSTNAFEFDGSDDYIKLNDNTLSPSDREFTVSAWVKTRDKSTDKFILDDKSTEGYSFLIDNYYGYDHVALYVGNSTETTRLRGETTVPTGEWAFVAATYNGSEMKVYLNGQLDGTKSSTTFEPYEGYAGPYIGYDSMRTGSNDYFNGKIDELRIYNRASII